MTVHAKTDRRNLPIETGISAWLDVNVRGWRLASLAVALTVAALILVVALAWFTPATDVWRHIAETVLAELLVHTAVLALGVGLGVLVLGTALAWLVATCEFPGRRYFDWALMLPLAIPAYVLAFVYVGLLDYSGPVQTGLRAAFGAMALVPADPLWRWRDHGNGARVLSVRVHAGARRVSGTRAHGARDRTRVRPKPVARVLACLAADGAAGARRRCRARGDGGARRLRRRGGVQLRHLHHRHLQGLAGDCSRCPRPRSCPRCCCCSCTRRSWPSSACVAGARYDVGLRSGREPRYRLTGWRRWGASAFAGVVLLLAFIVPLGQLLAWVWQVAHPDLDERYVRFFLNTLMLGARRRRR